MPGNKSVKNIFKNKAIMIMFSCILAGVLICGAIFVSLGVYMNDSDSNAIGQTGALYMKSMGVQVAKRFETAIDLRFNMVNVLVETIEGSIDNDNVSEAEEKAAVILHSKARGFDYVALYDGNDEMRLESVLGSELEITDKEPFKNRSRRLRRRGTKRDSARSQSARATPKAPTRRTGVKRTK